MYKIAVLGDYDSIYGFAALGLDTFPEEDPEEAARKLHELAGGGYAVVYITEKLAAELSAVIEKYRERVFPAIILIPGVSGNTGRGVESVRKSVEQAVGSDILFSKWRTENAAAGPEEPPAPGPKARCRRKSKPFCGRRARKGQKGGDSSK